MTPQPLGETPIQLTRTMVFFAALQAATDEGFCRIAALKFAGECATADFEQVKEFARRMAVRTRRPAEA